MQRRQWLQAAAATAMAAEGGLGSWLAQARHAPRKHAVLVGVGQLDFQPQHLWLHGPANDVTHMHVALHMHGFAPQHMTVLCDTPWPASATDRPPVHMPTRDNIVRSLEALQVEAGDAVVLYWSGHGVRTRATEKIYREADGHSTWLLARDARRAPPSSAWPLTGAVADAQVGAHVDCWLAAGAHVLVVMDTCHASSTTRHAAAHGLRWRGVQAAQLQSPEAAVAGAGSVLADLPLLHLPAPQARAQRFVGLYACEAQQRTPEWRVQGVPQGLFTRALLQALQAPDAQPLSYAHWARQALDVHAQLAHSSGIAASLVPRPVFEGSLQAPLWQGQPLPVWHEPAAQLRALPAQVQVQVLVQLPGQPWRVWPAEQWGANLQLGALPADAKVQLQVHNAAPDALYLRVFHVDAAQRWQAVFPSWQGDAPLLPGGLAQRPTRWQKEWAIASASVAQLHTVRCYIAPAQSQQWLEGTEAQAQSQAAWQGVVQWHTPANVT